MRLGKVALATQVYQRTEPACAKLAVRPVAGDDGRQLPANSSHTRQSKPVTVLSCKQAEAYCEKWPASPISCPSQRRQSCQLNVYFASRRALKRSV